MGPPDRIVSGESWCATVFEAMPMTVGVFPFLPETTQFVDQAVSRLSARRGHFFPRYIFRKANLSIAMKGRRVGPLHAAATETRRPQ
jgi:hypothetical protein